MTGFRNTDGPVFQWSTGGIRKPIVRYRLATGREVELLSFHLEPAWARSATEPRLAVDDVLRRLYPHGRAVRLFNPNSFPSQAFLAVALLCSEYATTNDPSVNTSDLLICDLVESIDRGVRFIVSEMLAKVDWEGNASNDFFW